MNSATIKSPIRLEYKGREICIGPDFVTIDGDSSRRRYGRLETEIEEIEALIDLEISLDNNQRL
jgi:hypothetical protein